MNQGVREFQVRVPAKYKNVEFTGPNIRSKEQSGDVWKIGLQDKVWGGYTLVVTYDFQFDALSTTLPLAGIHAVNVERETGSIALTTAASLQLTPQAAGETLHRVDETELAAADRALITRAVVFAWQYTGDQYDLKLAVQRFTEVPVLEAVADRTQITSVLAGSGDSNMTMPLQVELYYQDLDQGLPRAFALASVLLVLAGITLAIKIGLEWRRLVLAVRSH